MDAYTYAESGGSSPRSDFDNPPPPPPWEEQPPPPPQPPPHHKVKLMVSYGGKIQPRHHDNHLSYVGGETKILYVHRSISFPSLISKLSSLLISDGHGDHRFSHSISSFKYQLPGEDLDSLISVSNGEDLIHFMHEYDRLFRASPKPARLRIFLFPTRISQFGSGSSDKDSDSDNKVDFLFGLDNQVPVKPARIVDSDPQIILDLNRLQISGSNCEGKNPAVRVEHQQQQPVYNYVVQAPSPTNMYPAPLAQGYYYQVQQVASKPLYREHSVYSPDVGVPMAGLPENIGRLVYCGTTQGAGGFEEVTTSFQGTPGMTIGGDKGVRSTGVHGKIVSKVSPNSVV